MIDERENERYVGKSALELNEDAADDHDDEIGSISLLGFMRSMANWRTPPQRQPETIWNGSNMGRDKLRRNSKLDSHNKCAERLIDDIIRFLYIYL